MRYILILLVMFLFGCHDSTENNRKENVQDDDHNVEVDTPVDPGPEWEFDIINGTEVEEPVANG